ncbi:MAG: LamG-like jellyroll fold domain-containing protein [Mycobacteriales bacterium]
MRQTPATMQGRGREALAALVGVARVLAVAALAAYAGLLLIAVAPVALGMQSTVVLTGSMRPGIAPGDVVLSSSVPVSMLRPGQVLLVDNPAHPGVYLMHRYERTGPAGTIITRGDANRTEDSTPVPVGNVRGVPRLRVPAVGLPVVWLRYGTPAPVKYAAGAMVALFVLAFAAGPQRSRGFSRRAPATLVVSRPLVLRLRRTHAAVALVVVGGLVAQLSAPTASAAFAAAADNPSTFQAAASFSSSSILDDSPAGYWTGSEMTDAVSGGAATFVGTTYPGPAATSPGDASAYFPSPGALRVPKTTTGDFSIEFWFATTFGSGAVGEYDAGTPLLHSALGGAGDIGMSITADGHLLAGIGSTSSGTAATVVSFTGGYADGNWHHIVFTREDRNGWLSLFADRAFVGKTKGGIQPVDSRGYYYFGVSSDQNRAGAQRFDEIATYDSLLYTNDVQAHFDARASGYAAAVAVNNPAGYWRLDDLTGSIAVATAGAPGAYLGEVTRNVGPAIGSGTAIRLDPVGGYASVPRLISGDFSLEFWFTSTGGANTGQWWNTAGLVDADVPMVVDDFGVGLSETGQVVAGVGNPDTSIRSTSGYNDGAWHHVVFTRTMSTGGIVLYVDGAQVAANPGTGNTGLLDDPATLTVGRGSPTTPGNSAPSDATIDDLAQYTYVLTPAQVLAHYGRAAG